MAGRAARAVLGLGAPILVLALLVGGQVSTVVFVGVSLLFPSALIVLGTARDGRVGAAIAGFALLLAAILEMGGLAVLALAGRPTPLDGGELPASTLVMLGVLGLLAMAVVVGGHALLYDSGREGNEPRESGDAR